MTWVKAGQIPLCLEVKVFIMCRTYLSVIKPHLGQGVRLKQNEGERLAQACRAGKGQSWV